MVSGSSGSGIELFLLAFQVKPGSGSSTQPRWARWASASPLPSAPVSREAVVTRSASMATAASNSTSRSWRRSHDCSFPSNSSCSTTKGYASIRASQASFFGAPSIGCDASTGQSLPDIQRVAAAYGIPTDSITNQANLRQEIRRVLDRPGPVVCDIHVVLDEVRQPRLASSQRPDGSFVSKPLEDLWPFLDRSEFSENMLHPCVGRIRGNCVPYCNDARPSRPP